MLNGDKGAASSAVLVGLGLGFSPSMRGFKDDSSRNSLVFETAICPVVSLHIGVSFLSPNSFSCWGFGPLFGLIKSVSVMMTAKRLKGAHHQVNLEKKKMALQQIRSMEDIQGLRNARFTANAKTPCFQGMQRLHHLGQCKEEFQW